MANNKAPVGLKHDYIRIFRAKFWVVQCTWTYAQRYGNLVRTSGQLPCQSLPDWPCSFAMTAPENRILNKRPDSRVPGSVKHDEDRYRRGGDDWVEGVGHQGPHRPSIPVIRRCLCTLYTHCTLYFALYNKYEHVQELCSNQSSNQCFQINNYIVKDQRPTKIAIKQKKIKKGYSKGINWCTRGWCL